MQAHLLVEPCPAEKLLSLSSPLQSEPFVVEALFPLFELLHHYWINQADRDSCLQVWGGPGIPAWAASLAHWSALPALQPPYAAAVAYGLGAEACLQS